MVRIFRHYVSGLAVLLVVGDVAVVFVAANVVAVSGAWIGPDPVLPKVAFMAGAMILALNLGDLYDTRLPIGRRELVARVLTCQAATGLLIAAVTFVVPAAGLARGGLVKVGAVATLLLLVWRAAWLGSWSHQRMRLRVLVVGSGAIGKVIAGLEKTGARPFSIVGFLDDNVNAPDTIPEGHVLLGKIKDLATIATDLRPDVIVVAQMNRRGKFPTRALLDCRLQGIQVEDWPTFHEKATGKILVADLRPSWLIFSEGFVKTPRTEFTKRVIDLVLSAIGLVVTTPLIVLIAIVIKLDSSGPILFRQARLGRGGRIFTLNKFRSMRDGAETGTGPVWAQHGDVRITRAGRLLRRTRLDELPQLFNILLGHMSFIGPRPERPEFVYHLQKHIPFYMERHSVKPGLTGWAQIKYPYGSSMEDALEKLQYDLYYIKNLSLFLDLLILLNTVQVVLFARGR